MIDKIIEELELHKESFLSDKYEREYYMKQGVTDAIEIVKKYDNDGWISVEDRLPEEYLCKDGEYDPSEEVLCRLENGDMKFSRYWNHRRCRDTIITQPWLYLETYHNVIAWRKSPTKYKGE